MNDYGYYKQIIIPSFSILLDEKWIFQALLSGDIEVFSFGGLNGGNYYSDKWHFICEEGPPVKLSYINHIRDIYKERFNICFDAHNTAGFAGIE